MNPTGETPMSALRLRSLVLVLCAASLAGCSGGKPGAATAPATSSMTVTVAAPVRQAVAREVVASGSVAAWQEMSLGVELAGLRVSQVLVEVGSRVSAGQPLVLLDRRTLEVQARQAEASLAQARASLELARAQSARGDSLLEQKLISTANFDELRANLGKAAAQLAAAEAERDSSVLRLGFATLRAPYAGIVSGRSVQPGQVVSAGAELLRLIRGGRLEWRAEVSESDLPRIQPGAAVQLRGPTGETVEGRIRAVSPAIDPQTRTALIYADLPEPGSLRAGMFAEGRLGVGTADVVVLPRQSVVFRDGYPYVFVIGKESRVAQRRIEVGQSTGAQVEIRSGVAADESVVVRGAGFLGDGDLVKVVAGS
jgi:RND family efflux transporter MFP subunit